MGCRLGSEFIAPQSLTLQFKGSSLRKLPDDTSFGTVTAVACTVVVEAVGQVDGEFDGFAMAGTVESFRFGHG